jgi:hypothetical protein
MFLFLMILGFELRPCACQGRTVPFKPYPQPFLLSYFSGGDFSFLPGPASNCSPSTYASYIVGITSLYHYAHTQHNVFKNSTRVEYLLLLGSQIRLIYNHWLPVSESDIQQLHLERSIRSFKPYRAPCVCMLP